MIPDKVVYAMDDAHKNFKKCIEDVAESPNTDMKIVISSAKQFKSSLRDLYRAVNKYLNKPLAVNESTVPKIMKISRNLTRVLAKRSIGMMTKLVDAELSQDQIHNTIQSVNELCSATANESLGYADTALDAFKQMVLQCIDAPEPSKLKRALKDSYDDLIYEIQQVEKDVRVICVIRKKMIDFCNKHVKQ